MSKHPDFNINYLTESTAETEPMSCSWPIDKTKPAKSIKFNITIHSPPLSHQYKDQIIVDCINDFSKTPITPLNLFAEKIESAFSNSMKRAWNR